MLHFLRLRSHIYIHTHNHSNQSPGRSGSILALCFIAAAALLPASLVPNHTHTHTSPLSFHLLFTATSTHLPLPNTQTIRETSTQTRASPHVLLFFRACELIPKICPSFMPSLRAGRRCWPNSLAPVGTSPRSPASSLHALATAAPRHRDSHRQAILKTQRVPRCPLSMTNIYFIT